MRVPRLFGHDHESGRPRRVGVSAHQPSDQPPARAFELFPEGGVPWA